MEYFTGYTLIRYFSNIYHFDKKLAGKSLKNLMDGNFKVQEFFSLSRNTTFKIQAEFSGKKHYFFLKQGRKQEANSFIKNEYMFHHIYSEDLQEEYAIEVLWFDSKKQILVYEMPVDYVGVELFLLRNDGFFGAAGKLLGNIQNTLKIKAQARTYFKNFRPELLSKNGLMKEVERLKNLPSKALRDLAVRLEAMQNDFFHIPWNNEESIIHGDLKYNNFIIKAVSNVPGEFVFSSLKLTDWEFCCIGDSCWDAAFFISSFLDQSYYYGGNNAFYLSRLEILGYLDIFMEAYFNIRNTEYDKIILWDKVLRLSAVCSISNYILSIENYPQKDSKIMKRRLEEAIKILLSKDLDSDYFKRMIVYERGW